MSDRNAVGNLAPQNLTPWFGGNEELQINVDHFVSAEEAVRVATARQ